eukprot:TRINITY_DN75567_c0_g1_i1.p1 TRINITY_DN75567_c0_g1~~TRINITY_DN75567_c0_g1_i1.p1  ORF type:complete len:189 (-),score=43.25 TRINITY_DN75567_c0_g1_i1:138-704(-)
MQAWQIQMDSDEESPAEVREEGSQTQMWSKRPMIALLLGAAALAALALAGPRLRGSVGMKAATMGADLTQLDAEAAASSPGFSVHITQPGSGPNVQSGQTVSMNYVGKLTDGTIFDSTTTRGPFQTVIGVGKVIKCWDQGVVQLNKGAKATLTCPPDMAYGSQGVGPIPPDATLTFDVEVLDIQGMDS